MGQEKGMVYKECRLCGGVITEVSQIVGGVLHVSTFCRTCGRTTSRMGTNKKQSLGGDGAYCIFYKDSKFQDIGAMEKGVTAKDIESNVAAMMNDSNVDIGKTYATTIQNGKIIAIFGDIPLSYKEEIKKNSEENVEAVITTEDVDRLFSNKIA